MDTRLTFKAGDIVWLPLPGDAAMVLEVLESDAVGFLPGYTVRKQSDFSVYKVAHFEVESRKGLDDDKKSSRPKV